MAKESKQPHWVTLIVAFIGLAGVLGAAYLGYLGTRTKHDSDSSQRGSVSKNDRNDWGQDFPVLWSIEEEAQRSESAFAHPTEKELPLVRFDASVFGTRLEIWQSYERTTILMSDLTLHWDYKTCPRTIEYGAGGAVYTHNYRVELTKARGTQLLDTRKFKYPPGEYDDFNIELLYPGDGLYQVWVEFKYEILGSGQIGLFQSVKNVVWICPEQASPQ